MSVSIQQDDFDCIDEYKLLLADAPKIGAIVTFCGLVREFDQGQGLALELEHYPQMTEKVLLGIIAEAKARWPILNVRIVHRIGRLSLSEQIVFVGVNSEHRQAAFKACHFIMDLLKTKAPFWKKAISQQGDYWLAAKACDQRAKAAWE
ncbi:MAG: molybdenum cofactor biosynthesis protein MoaE [Pseudomonadota bacterium]